MTTLSTILTLSISGLSSSGKSTLSYQLQSLLFPPPLFTLQLDDFCLDIPSLPVRANGLPDADAVASVNMAAFKSALRHCKETGSLPTGFTSWQHPADIAEARRKAIATIGASKIEEARERVATTRKGRAVGIVEGFLLYQDQEIREMVDVKLFLRTSHAEGKARRMRRPGYGDPDTSDFWRTEGYYEECVWANYVKENRWMFEGGDVEGRVDETVCKNESILVQPGIDQGIEETFEWAVGMLCKALS